MDSYLSAPELYSELLSRPLAGGSVHMTEAFRCRLSVSPAGSSSQVDFPAT